MINKKNCKYYIFIRILKKKKQTIQWNYIKPKKFPNHDARGRNSTLYDLNNG